jgi:hypothetical protein
VLPMMPGVPERATHDYLRHGVRGSAKSIDHEQLEWSAGVAGVMS